MCFAMEPSSTVSVGNGDVKVFPLEGGLSVHLYETKDPLGDYVQLIETKNALLGFDNPAFKKDFGSWGHYIESLKKPLKLVVISNHANDAGPQWRENAPFAAPNNVKEATTAGASKAISDSLSKNFGAEFVSSLGKINETIPLGQQKLLGSVNCIILQDGPGIVLVLPEQKAAFMHMLGADTHSIVGSPEQADKTIALLKQLKKDGVTMVFTDHHKPETGADIDKKIEYLEAVKGLLLKSKTARQFKEAVLQKYPNLLGKNYLDMTCSMNFPS